MIAPNFYSVLKVWGLSTERLEDGTYKSERSQIAWDAYRCGKLGISIQQLESDSDNPEREQSGGAGGDRPDSYRAGEKPYTADGESGGIDSDSQ